MSEYLSDAVRDELANARPPDNRRKPRLTVKVGGNSFTILRTWDTGFAVDANEAPKMRGFVDVYDGVRHVAKCLVYATVEEAGQMHYEYKRETRAADGPALDYERSRPVMRRVLTI